MIQDIKGLLEQEWQEYAKLTPYEKDQKAQWDYARQKAAQFGARESVVEEYKRKIRKGQKLLVLQGTAGSGKSTLMSRFAVNLSEEGYQVVPIFCGNTLMSDNTLDLIKSIVHYIEDACSLPHFEDQMHRSKRLEEDDSDREEASAREWADKMAELVAYYEANEEKTLVIFIDAADQLFADEVRDRLMFIPTNPFRKGTDGDILSGYLWAAFN